MIRAKKELVSYLLADAEGLHRQGIKPAWFGDECWRFQWHLRHTEFYFNTNQRIRYAWHKFWLRRLAIQLGFSISINCFGPGLQLMHRGTIVVNDKARIGANCRIHVCVNIGEKDGGAPRIGNNVYIGPGAKLFGNIEIADDITIGANAVVNKSFTTPGISIGGVPAKRLRAKGEEAPLSGLPRGGLPRGGLPAFSPVDVPLPPTDVQ